MVAEQISPVVGGEPVRTIGEVLDRGAVHSVFQPIVDLATTAVVGFEALARGPVGDLESPAALFPAARRAGLLPELDAACRTAALRGARRLGLRAPLSVFVNVEPEVLDGAPLTELLSIAGDLPGELQVVLEITERALAARPAELLRTIARTREMGWWIALDDVGAEPASLAFLSLLRPDVVKLDLSLVQGRPGSHVAEIMHAVNAYAERTGALLLAEGIESEEHLAAALSLGATLGQGWHFGRPTDSPELGRDIRGLAFPSAQTAKSPSLGSPFDCLPAHTVLRHAPKRLLIEVSKHLEREAMRLGKTCVVASTFQHSQNFTPATSRRYERLVESAGFVCALGEGLPLEPVPGLRGAELDAADPVVGEWDIVVLHPHFGAALLSRDLGDTGPDLDRRFEYALTFDREVVVRAARGLLLRVSPRRSPAAPSPVANPTSLAG